MSEQDDRERYAEALHRAMWGTNAVQGMTAGGVHRHTTDPIEHAAQREFIRRCINYAEGLTGLVPATPATAPTPDEVGGTPKVLHAPDEAGMVAFEVEIVPHDEANDGRGWHKGYDTPARVARILRDYASQVEHFTAPAEVDGP